MITMPKTENLSVNEQFALITDIQNVPTTVTVQEDGSEFVTYGVTPASEAAGEKLMAAFWPAIRAAARSTKLRGNEEEAEAVALEAFVRAVREFDLTGDTPFHHVVPNVMRRAVRAADRQDSTQVTIPDVQVKRYFRVFNEHGRDAATALAAVRLAPEVWLLSPEAFLTIHLALQNSTSLDAPASTVHEELAAPAPMEDTVITREYVRWLLDQTTDRQQAVCRLAYGFADLDTENLRVSHGYREGDVLEDLQVADCLGVPRSTVNRERNKALATMRTAAENSTRDE